MKRRLASANHFKGAKKMSEGTWSAVAIHQNDNVAVALRGLQPGEVRVRCGDGTVVATLSEPVELGHKFALRNIGDGETVIKYGEAIGVACSDICAGAHVHIHNLRSNRARKAPAASAENGRR